MTDSAFITGTSSGLGQALAAELLEQGRTVYGLSRRPAGFDSSDFQAAQVDLSELDAIAPALDRIIGEAHISLVILCAGMLGEFKTMPELGLAELRRAMDINVWANKIILDWFARHRAPQQVILISSGAGVTGNKGWGSYALSKAALNMLTQLYAHDLPGTHLTALAPGLVHTAMQDYISGVDVDEFPSVKRLQDARGTAAMPSPRAAARTLLEALPQLRAQYASGSFADLRRM